MVYVGPEKKWLQYLPLGPRGQKSQPLRLHSQHIGAMQATALGGLSLLHRYPELGSWKEYTIRLRPGQDWGGGREQIVHTHAHTHTHSHSLSLSLSLSLSSQISGASYFPS